MVASYSKAMLFPYTVINQAVMWLCVGGVDTNPYLSWSINLYYGFLLSVIKIVHEIVEVARVLK